MCACADIGVAFSDHRHLQLWPVHNPPVHIRHNDHRAMDPSLYSSGRKYAELLQNPSGSISVLLGCRGGFMVNSLLLADKSGLALYQLFLNRGGCCRTSNEYTLS